MSKYSDYLVVRGWRIFGHRKRPFRRGSIALWYHPSDGSRTYTQTEAIALARKASRAEEEKRETHQDK